MQHWKTEPENGLISKIHHSMGRSKPPRYLGWTKEEHGWWAWPAVSSQEGSSLPPSLWGGGLGRRCVCALNSGLLAWIRLAGIKPDLCPCSCRQVPVASRGLSDLSRRPDMCVGHRQGGASTSEWGRLVMSERSPALRFSAHKRAVSTSGFLAQLPWMMLWQMSDFFGGSEILICLMWKCGCLWRDGRFWNDMC